MSTWGKREMTYHRPRRGARSAIAAAVLSLLTAVTLVGSTTPASALLAQDDGDHLLRVVDKGDAIRLDGYLAVSDGTLLRMQVDRPKGHERVPTLLMYQGYTHLVDAEWPQVGFRQWAMDNGYALMVATTRGTACSGGAWDFLAHREALDARDLIEWAAGQPWSDGKVAMVGESYAGFEQLRVASLRPPPPALVAIAPAAPFADLYRDVVAPGGIPNTLLPAGFTELMLEGSLRASGYHLYNYRDDPDFGSRCLRYQAERSSNPLGSPFAQFTTRRWDDDFLRDRSPGRDDIALPMLVLTAWQDQVLGSRGVDRLLRMTGPVHAVLSNGDHTNMWTSSSYQEQLRAFLDFYVKGIPNSFDDQDRIQLWWETTRTPNQWPVTESTPTWRHGVPRLPAPNAQVAELQLSEGGTLTVEPGFGPPDSYVAIPGNGQARDGSPTPLLEPTSGDLRPSEWTLPAGDGYSLAYTSAPLPKDLTALGSAAVDLWLTSSAPDTDVQVVLTEVRPDGQEMYVQAGWLRGSHRAEDAQRTEPARPFHTHRREHTAPLIPGTPTRLRVEINPFGHVFRAGSSIRLWIEAPASTFGLRSLEPLPFAAVNQVHHDAEHPSVLRLSTLPGRHAPVPHPKCGTVIRQPCRPDPLAAR